MCCRLSCRSGSVAERKWGRGEVDTKTLNVRFIDGFVEENL
jgi:hypothetical protein